jgi:hypothetical protein
LLRTAYVKCRSWGHAWSSFIPTLEQRREMWGDVYALRCERCHTERFDTINSLGQLDGRRYVYPYGYATAKDDRPSAEQLRLELIERKAWKAEARRRANA